MNDHENAVPGWDEVRAAGSVPPVRPAVLERARQVVREAAAVETTAPRRRRRRPMYVVLGAAVAAGVTVAAVLLTGGDPEPPAIARPEPSPSATRTGPLPDGGGASCVEAYSPETLRNRAFVFDGTVMAIGDLDSDGIYRAVTFEVHEWFRGDGGGNVTVAMMDGGDPSGDDMSEWGPAYEVGTRLLASGEPRWGGAPLDEPVVWTCGFTRYYDEATAAQWREALAEP